MHERFAVVFRDGEIESAGALEVEQDRLLLLGRADECVLELEIPVSELSEVRVGRRRNERLNGYPTLLLERASMPPVQVAPLGVALLPEIADLLVSLARRKGGNELTVSVPLKPGCLGRARKLLRQGPPLDPSALGLDLHEVYLLEGEAVFVFRGGDVHAQIGKAIRHPAVWRAGLAWQRCFAGPPQIVDLAQLELEVAPAYRWKAESPNDGSALD
ncbi:MAG TPA: hypothetical protein VFU33_07950 [Gaiellaceae bacterium]|nr:hypothetical protein [Gaiellaceae bacterium]